MMLRLAVEVCAKVLNPSLLSALREVADALTEQKEHAR
jgi:hypothetical protein